jgi:hypothetical protein
MLVTLGNRGNVSWMCSRYAKLYGDRLNLVELLSDPGTAGRDHVLFATDEILPNAFNYLRAPTHVLAVRTRDVKLGTYSHWARGRRRCRARCGRARGALGPAISCSRPRRTCTRAAS